jgi:hypothetical protein
MSRESLKGNEEKLAQAERILQLAELGRKLETEKEKVDFLVLRMAGMLTRIMCR